jgi:hypothetical protein
MELELDTPAIELPRTGHLTIRTPPIPEVRRWFFDHLGWNTGLGPDPARLGGVTLPRAHLDRVVDLLLTRWETVDLFREYLPDARCTPRCRAATGLSCTCSCSGEEHGSLSPEQPVMGAQGTPDLINTGSRCWSLARIQRS